jgi:hypothetical protein
MRDRLKFNVPVDQFDVLLPNGSNDPDNFVVAWQSWDSAQKIYTGFTNGMSTFTGKRITQCQIVTNGNLPRASEVENILASSLAVGEDKILAEGWGLPRNALLRRPTPSIPLGGSAKEIQEAVFAMNSGQIASRTILNALGAVRPTHIHIHSEPEILEAMHNLGAKQRMLGPHPMQTGRIDLTDRLEAAGNAQNARLRLVDATAKPFQLVA